MSQCLRAKVLGFSQCPLWPMSSSTHVRFDQCPLWPMSTSTNVCFDQCPLWPMSAMTNVCYNQCPLWPMSSSTNVRLNQCPLWPKSTSTNVRFDRCLLQPMSTSTNVCCTEKIANDKCSSWFCLLPMTKKKIIFLNIVCRIAKRVSGTSARLTRLVGCLWLYGQVRAVL